MLSCHWMHTRDDVLHGSTAVKKMLHERFLGTIHHHTSSSITTLTVHHHSSSSITNDERLSPSITSSLPTTINFSITIMKPLLTDYNLPSRFIIITTITAYHHYSQSTSQTIDSWKYNDFMFQSDWKVFIMYINDFNFPPWTIISMSRVSNQNKAGIKEFKVNKGAIN